MSTPIPRPRSAALPLTSTFEVAGCGRTFEVTISPCENLVLAGLPAPRSRLVYVVDGTQHGASLITVARLAGGLLGGAESLEPLTVVVVSPKLETPGQAVEHEAHGRSALFAPRGDPAGHEGSDAAAFLTLLRERVDPEVRRRTPVTDQPAVFFGHGLAGLFGAAALAAQDPLFDTYLLASPTLLRGSTTLASLVEAPPGSLRGKLFLTISGDDLVSAESPRHGGDIEQAFHELSRLLLLEREPHLQGRSRTLPDESFESLAWPTIMLGLREFCPGGGWHGLRVAARNPSWTLRLVAGMSPLVWAGAKLRLTRGRT